MVGAPASGGLQKARGVAERPSDLWGPQCGLGAGEASEVRAGAGAGAPGR